MNWKSEEGRALLRRAWPEGYLAMRGVLTVDNCVCVEASAGHVTFWAGMDTEYSYPDGPAKLLACGSFLPNPDPFVHATWACLKADLARAVGWTDATELIWCQMMLMDDSVQWCLSKKEDNRKSVLVHFDIRTNDPAEALVRARIQVREQ